ncbi:DEAD/DEAH box helicase [Brevundimonas sp.]|uniref:DEAD/DEAH box helicase n=1 Tax=Brevundimonas sp. TaxID=1871086 RepID=UPI002FDB27A4
MTFTTELANRLIANEQFAADFDALQAEAALAVLPGKFTDEPEYLSTDAVHRLLYCASVFVQSDQEPLRALAQSVALGSLLARGHDIGVEPPFRLLTDLGNFPALTYAESRHSDDVVGLAQSLRAAVSRDLNAFDVGDERLSLTDFQKRAWDRLQQARALAISAPTSAGKSFLVIEHLCRLVEQAPGEFTAVYIAPTRALLSEVHASIQRRLQDSAVRVSTVPTPGTVADARQVFVLTQERLQVLLAVSDPTFDLVIVDEAQNVSDGSRGMILQETLDQILSRSPKARLVMLAPGAAGFVELGRSFGAPHLEPAESRLPSVIQNRILASPGRIPRTLTLRIMTETGSVKLGTLTADRGFSHPESRLAAVALELGGDGGSLVYATGPKHAEFVALNLAQGCKQDGKPSLDVLAQFIKQHIHPDYGLARLVKRGVAFHYGKMPTLLREAIEGAFKAGDLRFLACTTTLFQGVNLPARNVFIDTSTRGRGNALDAAELWNFAGRAGRMKADVVGNVFLVDYENWPEKPMDHFVGYKIEPAFRRTVENHATELTKALGGEMPPVSPQDETPSKVRAAAGLLISRAVRGDVAAFIDRTLPQSPEPQRSALIAAATEAGSKINLPASLLATNWTVDPFGLRRLLNYLIEQIEQGNADAMIPQSPLANPTTARERYAELFRRIEGRVNLGASGKLPEKAALPAVMWMEGKPYPVLLSSAVKSARTRYTRELNAHTALLQREPRSRRRAPRAVDVNNVIYEIFALIEDVVRFRYVQLGKAYYDVLVLALQTCGLEHRVPEIFDFALALELGVSTRSGWSFMELGLSRIAATALEPHFPDSDMSVDRARDWLRQEDLAPFKLGPIVLAELGKLGLASQEAIARANAESGLLEAADAPVSANDNAVDEGDS